jgi:hypothetical protein
MRHHSVHRTLVLVLLAGAMLLPLACNMPAPVSAPDADESESVWEWLALLAAYRSAEPRATSTITPDPLMQAVNEGLASQMQTGPLAPMIEAQSDAYLAPKSDFSCLEESGSMVKYLDEYPSEPSLETNSAQNKDFLFALLQDGNGGFELSWHLTYEILHRVVDSTENADQPKIYHERTYESSVGQGDLESLGLGQFTGALRVQQKSVGEAGNKYNIGPTSSTVDYSVAGLYDPEANTMHLCLSGVNPLPQSRSQGLLAGGVPLFRTWCLEANLSYFVCSEGTLFRPAAP